MIENPKHVDALNLFVDKLAPMAHFEGEFYRERRKRPAGKPGETVANLPPEQRELLSHLRSEDVSKVCWPWRPE